MSASPCSLCNFWFVQQRQIHAIALRFVKALDAQRCTCGARATAHNAVHPHGLAARQCEGFAHDDSFRVLVEGREGDSGSSGSNTPISSSKPRMFTGVTRN